MCAACGGILYSEPYCRLPVVLEEHSHLQFETQPFGHKIQFINLQHSTELVSHAGMPFVYAFGWQICDVLDRGKPVKLHLQLGC